MPVGISGGDGMSVVVLLHGPGSRVGVMETEGILDG